MTGPAFEPYERPRDPDDDSSFVPGLGRNDEAGPAAGAVPPGPLDMSKDPDRYDPDRDDVPYVAPGPVGPLDMSQDPDRYRPPGQGQTLTDLLGEGAFEDQRDNTQWAWGLAAVVGFLLLVSWLFGSVLSPR